ncbi:MAG: TlpA family protein disulfide reductase [Planctomycetales bacterium]|nr:TlpA family protein disulfide reductase [Planctomycetales bacterium]
MNLKYSLQMLMAFVCTGICGIGCQSPSSSDSPISDASVDSVVVNAENTVQVAEVSNAESRISVQLGSLDELQARVKNSLGKVVVVDIWSTSCLPCMREFPNLIALSQRFENQVSAISFNVDYIGLSKKPPESYVPKVQEFLLKQEAAIENVLSTTPDSEVFSHFEVGSIPCILIFDQQGLLNHTLTDDTAGVDGLSYERNVLPLVENLLSPISSLPH